MNLKDFLNDMLNQQQATSYGAAEHQKMEHIVVDDVAGDKGDPKIIKSIREHPELIQYFTADAKTEVGIAGVLDGKFVSKRIDRLCINHAAKKIVFIDYKTDDSKETYIKEYKEQLSGYKTLLTEAYPNYDIEGYILWLKYWELQKIV